MRKKIDKITIKGFKSIKDIDGLELGNINIVVGANGAGKSNLVQIFRMMRRMLAQGFQKFVAENGGADAFLYGGRKTTKAIEINLEFGRNTYRLELSPTADEKLSLEEAARYQDSGWRIYGSGALESQLESHKNDGSYLYPGSPGVGHYVYAAVSRWMVYHFHDTSSGAPMRLSEIVEDNGYLRENASNIAPFLLSLRDGGDSDKAAYGAIVNAVRIIMPFFYDFSLIPKDFGAASKVNLSWRQKGSDYPFQPYHLSDGSIRFICLATALLQPNPPSTIIIDEPELGLHPQAIIILAELMRIASKRTQVIVATQSPLLIDQFSAEEVIVAKRKDGATQLERLDPEELKVWLEEYTLGELWVNNVIEAGPDHE